ncbi:MAG: hypothetical protein ABI594_02300 [Ginsengibacter sp.]
MEVKPNIEINIGELVLHGFSPADKFRIGQAVEQHLTSLFIEQGVPSSLQKNNDQLSLKGGSFQLSENDSAGSIGNQIAGTVYSGFKPE